MKNVLWSFILLYIFLYIILFSGYQYIIDPDATGYLSVAEKVANSKYFQSINGIWSPLSSWFLVPFIKAGGNTIMWAKYLNCLYSIISLCLFINLIKKLQINMLPAMLMMGAAILLLLHFSFSRLFGDNLVVTILLGYLNILYSKNFINQYWKIIFAGIMGSLAFYAKAYSFYFVLFHLPIIIIYLEKQQTGVALSISVLKKISVGITVLCLVSSLWFIALHNKYGHFILGQKNVTGTLTDLSNPIKKLVHPPAIGDYALFDDISNVNNVELTPFDNPALFIIQLKLTVTNFLMLLISGNEFSAFFWMIIFVGWLFAFSRKTTMLSYITVPLLIFIAIWTSGFLLFSIQSRFLWIINLIVLCLAGIQLTQLHKSYYLNKLQKFFCCIVIIGSFYIYPSLELKKDYKRGKDLFELAQKLKANNINGNILAGIQSDENYSSTVVLNYLNKSKLYGTYLRDYSSEDIIKAVQQYSIDYYFFYYKTKLEKESFLQGEIYKNGSVVFENIHPGLVVIRFDKR